DNWVQFEAVATLAKEVETHLDAAVRGEREASERWVHLLENMLGDTDPKELNKAIKGALDAAGEVGGVRFVGVQHFETRLMDLAAQPITACFRDAQRAVAAADFATQLSALGKLNRGLMSEYEKFLADADKVLTASTQGIRDTMR